MGYANKSAVDLILAQALTSARPEQSTSTGRTKLIGIGGIANVRDTNRIPDEVVEQYISFSDNQIDGILSQQYFTPFNKCANGQWDLDEDINISIISGTDVGTDTAGITVTNTTSSSANDDTIVVNSSVNLVEGDEIIIHDDLTGDEEVAIVKTLIDQNTFQVTSPVEGVFLADSGVRIIRSQFPPPLNQISARYAASYIYDKYFAAQASPNVSDYGKEMRAIAMGQLNDILNGKTILKCARRRGDIFGNPWLSDSYSHQDRGYNTSERDMSKPQ